VTDDIDSTCRHALGFLELGMPEDALAELDELSVSSSLALHLRVDALIRLKNWREAASICLPMTEQEPADPGWWVQAAFAQRRARSIETAEAILRKALRHHPGHGLILYNLACYACVQDRPDEARELILGALQVDPAQVLAMAKKDPDLQPLRPWLDGFEVENPARAADDDDLGLF
jgi:tetratricopeptide (TPR) repeat protein